MKKYYEILGLQPGASENEIKKAYKKMALKWHPDKNQNSEESQEKFKEIGEAYEILTNKDKQPSIHTRSPFMNPNDLFSSLFGGSFHGGNVHVHRFHRGTPGGMPRGMPGGMPGGMPRGFPVHVNMFHNGTSAPRMNVTTKQVQTMFQGDNKIEIITEHGPHGVKQTKIVTNMKTGEKKIQ